MIPTRIETHLSSTHLASLKVKKRIMDPTAVVKSGRKEITVPILSAYRTEEGGLGGATRGNVRVR